MTIDVHGPLDRAKDASPYDESLVGFRDGCMRVMAHADGVPLLGDPEGTPLSSARAKEGRRPFSRFGPIEVFVPTTPREERRHSEDRGAFHRRNCGGCEGRILRRSVLGLPLTPSTRPTLWEVL